MKLENLIIGKCYRLLNYFPFPKNHIAIYFKFKEIEIVDENYCYVCSSNNLIFQDNSNNTFSKPKASSILFYNYTNKFLFPITKREYYSVIRKYIIYEIKSSIR